MKKVLSLLLAVVTAAVFLCSCGNQKLSLDKKQITILVGESAQLSAGDAVKVHWSSSNEAVATVSGGTVNAKSAGEAVITASGEDGSSAECKVTVTEKLITEVTLDTKSARVEPGKTIQITASFKPADASVTDLSWSSDNENVAAVDDKGYVTGIYDGMATITCTSANGVSAACTVIVGGLQVPTVASNRPKATQKPQETTSVPSEAPKSTEPTREKATTGAIDSEGFVFPDSSVQYLTKDEISATFGSKSGSPVSQSFAQDAVNEIFARHGYVFSTPEIRSYYESQPWYHADPGYDGTLSDVEIYNIGLLSGY